jgi:hypothetical protein
MKRYYWVERCSGILDDAEIGGPFDTAGAAEHKARKMIREDGSSLIARAYPCEDSQEEDVRPYYVINERAGRASEDQKVYANGPYDSPLDAIKDADETANDPDIGQGQACWLGRVCGYVIGFPQTSEDSEYLFIIIERIEDEHHDALVAAGAQL